MAPRFYRRADTSAAVREIERFRADYRRITVNHYPSELRSSFSSFPRIALSHGRALSALGESLCIIQGAAPLCLCGGVIPVKKHTNARLLNGSMMRALAGESVDFPTSDR